MGEIGQFGEITFEVSSDKLLTFEDFKRESESNFQNHALIAQKPRTEFIAPGLDTISFTVILNAQFGVKPRDEMNRWLEYCRSGDAEWLAVGGKLMGVDRWVVKSVSQSWDVIYDGGILASGKVNITLQEYCSEMWTVRGYHAGLVGQSTEKLRELGISSKTMETIRRLEQENNPTFNSDSDGFMPSYIYDQELKDFALNNDAFKGLIGQDGEVYAMNNPFAPDYVNQGDYINVEGMERPTLLFYISEKLKNKKGYLLTYNKDLKELELSKEELSKSLPARCVLVCETQVVDARDILILFTLVGEPIE